MVAMRWGLVAAVLMAGCLPTGRYAPEPAGASGGPAAPRLVQPPSPTRDEQIPIEGYAGPGQQVEIYVNSVLVGQTVALTDGRFLFPQVRLQMGLNTVTAVAIDDKKRRSTNAPTGGGERVGSEGVLKPEVRVMRQ